MLLNNIFLYVEDNDTVEIKPSTVAVALSGGVDSSLAAALLKKSGWDVTGLHFILSSTGPKKRAKRKMVRRIAEFLHIPVKFIDLEAEFDRNVVAAFMDAYLTGMTPNPCVTCNQVIKFHHLRGYADKNGIEYIATGHYANIKNRDKDIVELWRGNDKKKDQSYFLHRLKRTCFSKILFPLGSLTKVEVRRIATEMGIPASSEPESQEICFIPGNDYRAFMEIKKGCGIINKGNIVDVNGNIVGEHLGTYRFTTGQRHGLGIASTGPYYVMSLRPDKNEIVVGRKDDLFSSLVYVDSFNSLTAKPPQRPVKVMAQVRYRHRPAPCLLEILSPDRVRVCFDEPQWAITPGQALVCYEDGHVLGGGWIMEKIPE